MTMMRKVFLSMVCAIMAIWMLGSCASTEERAARRAETARKVTAALDGCRYKIDVQMMHPQRGASRHLSSSYSVEVRNDSLISYLPYFGRAYDIPYGGGKALNFSAPIASYQEFAGKKGLRVIEIGAENEEDKYLYTIQVYENGSSSINVIAQKREPISFSGMMVTE